MSMPHTCRCGICQQTMEPVILPPASAHEPPAESALRSISRLWDALREIVELNYPVDDDHRGLLEEIDARYGEMIGNLDDEQPSLPPGARQCEWSEIEAGSGIYNTCKKGEEFHLTEGLELYPYCQWCGGKIVVETNDAAR